MHNAFKKQLNTDMRILVCSLCCFITLRIHAQTTTTDFISLQNFTPPSPEAAALGRYGEIPVSYASGIPEISIPIYNVASRKISVPLSLSYHASGIKIDDIASTAGLGWVLNAGGAISRNVVGKPDEAGINVGYTYKYKDRSQLEGVYYTGASDTNFYYLDKMAKGEWDTQSDVYNITTPFFSGRFVFDLNGTPRFTGVDKPLKIQWNTVSSTFTVIDDNGMQYIFGEKETTTHISGGSIYTSAWYTSMIISADATDTVFFTYTAAAPFIDLFESQNYYVSQDYDFSTTQVGGCPVPGVSDHFNIQSEYLQYNRKLLSSIRFSAGTVNFEYASDRQDPGTERLTAVKIYAAAGMVKQVKLEHGYFQSTTNLPLSQLPRQTKRLRLEAVEEADPTGASVNRYTLEYNTSQLLPAYYKSYNGTLPVGKTAAGDLWGYYNGSTSDYNLPANFRQYLSTFIITKVPAVSNTLLNTYDSYSWSRYPNPDFTQAGMLQRINYPAGGATVFEYENNKTANNGDNSDYSGGLRIRQITSYEPAGKPVVKTFSYGDNNSGTGISIATLVPDDFYYETLVLNKNNTGPTSNNLYSICYGVHFYVKTNPITAINYYGGSPVFYDKVTAFNGYPGANAGKTEYTFDYMPDSAYAQPDAFKYWNFSTDKSWARGLPLTTKVYKYENGAYTLIKQTANTYTEIGRNAVKVGYLCEQKALFNNTTHQGHLDYLVTVGATPMVLTYFDYMDIVLSYGVKKLVKTEETDYANGTITQKKEWAYEGNGHMYPTLERSYNSDASITYTYTRYPQDKAAITGLSTTASTAIDGMVTANILATPIETEEVKNGVTQLKNRTEFKNWNAGKYYPEYRSQQIRQNAMEQRVQYTAYDERGNVTGLTKPGDAGVAYIWDYNKNYVVAQAINAIPAEVAFTSFEPECAGNWTITSTARVTTAFTGTAAYNLTSGNITRTALTSGKAYIVSYWSQNGASMQVNSTAGTALVTRPGWTLYEHKVTATSITVSGSGIIDELKLYPADAQMTGYTHSPLIGITAVDKSNGNIEWYRYDNAGRLKSIVNQDNYIVKQLSYQVQNSAGVPAGWQAVNSAPNWLPNSQLRCKPNSTTGEQQAGYTDQNPYSSTYLQLKWTTIGSGVCSCMPANAGCTGENKKMINGCCETGYKVYTSSTYMGFDKWQCVYHYLFSDGSVSSNYTEVAAAACIPDAEN